MNQNKVSDIFTYPLSMSAAGGGVHRFRDLAAECAVGMARVPRLVPGRRINPSHLGGQGVGSHDVWPQFNLLARLRDLIPHYNSTQCPSEVRFAHRFTRRLAQAHQVIAHPGMRPKTLFVGDEHQADLE
jgi:hypothetical protein